MRPNLTPYLYFIQAENGPIKIGHSSDPEGRLAILQQGNPYPLHLLAKIPQLFCEERALHKKYASLRMAGEWFDPSDDLLSEIKGLSEKT
jgi:hypothetical protein